MRKLMRLYLTFDLPVVEKEDLQNYQKFRRFLLNDGYDMLQFSVYAILCNGHDDVTKHLNRLKEHLPPKGSIRVTELTEKQFASTILLVGKKKPKENKKFSQQLTLFDDDFFNDL